MTYLLIITMTLGGTTERQAVGIMISREACAVAGAGMVEVLERATPGVRVEAVCVSGVAA